MHMYMRMQSREFEINCMHGFEFKTAIEMYILLIHDEQVCMERARAVLKYASLLRILHDFLFHIRVSLRSIIRSELRLHRRS